MSRADIWISETGGLNATPTDRWVVAAGTPPTIRAGEPAKQNAAGDENVILLVDADLTVGTDQPMAGVAAIDSSEVSGTAGYVDVYTPLINTLYEMLVLTASAADAQSEIDAFIGSAMVMDLTSSAFRMDTAAGNAAANAFIITGGDINISSVKFRIRSDATRFGRAQV